MPKKLRSFTSYAELRSFFYAHKSLYKTLPSAITHSNHKLVAVATFNDRIEYLGVAQ